MSWMRACLCIVLIIGIVDFAVADESEGSAILILDASGSMWGQVEGRTKIEIAREVIASLLQDWDPGVKLGLMAYGHRKKGDCEDIEMLVQVGGSDLTTIRAAIAEIQPKGKTPLTEAVRRAAHELRYTEQRATVILVSDGEENCNADPCTVGAELAMSGVDFTAHVVGFDVAADEEKGLRCMAASTGGLYLSASNASELKDALSEAAVKTQEPARPVVEDPGDASLTAPKQAAAGSPFQVNWTGPDSRNDYITIVPKAADDGAYLSYAFTESGNPVSLTAPADVGSYELRYVFGHGRRVLARTPIEVTQAAAAVKALQDAVAGAQFNVEWQGPGNANDYITIVKTGSKEGTYLSYALTKKGSPLQLTAPAMPGPHEVWYVLGDGRRTIARCPITITEVSATVQAPAQVKTGQSFEVKWIGPNHPTDYVTIVKKGAKDAAYLSYASTKNGSPSKLIAPDVPGSYEVRYVMGTERRVLASAPVTVK